MWTGRISVATWAGAWLSVFTVGFSPSCAAAAPADVSWLITCEDQPWALALAAPVAARLQESGPRPLCMAVTNPPTREAEWLLTLSSSANTFERRPIVLATSGRMKLGTVLQRRSPIVLKIGSDPCAASAAVARHFWTQSRSAVVAAADDPEAAILGSALAASLRVPLLLCEHDQPGTGVEAALKELAVARVLVAVSDAHRAPHWIDRSTVPTEILPPQALEHRLIARLGRAKVRNVIVARAPDDRADVGHTAWLAPYVSLARGAAVVLVRAQAAAVAETNLQRLIEHELLHVQTVTVLADYTSIGYRSIEVDPNGSEDWAGATTSPAAAQQPATVPAAPNSTPSAPSPPATSGGTGAAPAPPPHYTVRTEPFVPTQPDQLAEFGVGRLPLESLSDTSIMFARGLLREHLLGNRPSRVLMVANSGMLRKLVICETISRVTASEFKNLGVEVDEFYGRWADAPEILSAARSANLILYEGHLSAQELIDAPVLRRAPSHNYPQDDDDLEGVPGSREGPPAAPAPRVVLAEPIARHLQGPLNGLPIVVLQSCESLDDAVLWRLDELGGVALIGSMTPIHSAAGSAMLNAAMSSMLYRGGTLGEVLRDAQNYMLCVEELKGRRGHKEQAKGVRVALSFRLWGDPEMRVLPTPPSEPRQAPVRAEWIGRDALRITLPAQKLPEFQCDKYAACAFPNSQFAGLMKTEDDATKRISPVYFFALPLPDNLAASNAVFLAPSRSESKHLEIRVDASRRMAYVVYLPDQEKPGESVVLRLREARPAESFGRSSP